MKNIKVVIGANFGDEGKGLMTDYFSSKETNGVVVRFNGGSQAGHTVCTIDGKRHVFGHFGSGSFIGLPTFLSEYFVVNPITFNKELCLLKECSEVPQVYIDGECIVTTPYDMLINQISEIVRGKDKHGSCGLGFNETIQRSVSNEKLKIIVTDLMDISNLREKLKKIKDIYVYDRLKELNITSIPDSYKELLINDNIIENYIKDIRTMLNCIKISNIKDILNFDTIIFEGAQGLLLDQNHKFFPHVTRSNTGIKNVQDIISKLKIRDYNMEIIYITRAYMTRHGVGPFINEINIKPYEKIEDLTNIPNPYQGTLRFGFLDINELDFAIKNDLSNVIGPYKLSIAITCLDQIDNKAKYILDSKKNEDYIESFINTVLKTTNINKAYLSYGPTRQTIHEFFI